MFRNRDAVSMRESLFHFAKNGRSPQGGSVLGQARKVVEEAWEVVDAIEQSEDDERVLEEAWDVIHAAEGVLRCFDEQDVRKARMHVKVKCALRGDYAAKDLFGLCQLRANAYGGKRARKSEVRARQRPFFKGRRNR